MNRRLNIIGVEGSINLTSLITKSMCVTIVKSKAAWQLINKFHQHDKSGTHKSPSVTGFVKTCIVHTSNFGHLGIRNYHREWHTDLKLLGVIQK